MGSLEDWMRLNGFIAFRAFSATDASDLPTGWTKPTKFSLDGVVFYNGNEMTLFTDAVHRMLIKDKSTKTKPLDEIQEWLDTKLDPGKGPFTLVGYGSKKFDSPLLNAHYNASASHLDLSEIVSEITAKYYGDYGRRYDLRSLSAANHKKQTAIPHLSFLLKPIALLSEWQRGLARNVMRTLAAEVELIAELFCQIKTREELKIRDERTDKLVPIGCDFIRDVTPYSFTASEIDEEE